MFKHVSAAVLAAAFAVAPSAMAGEFFVNAQIGQAQLKDMGLEDDKTDAYSLGLGYRWHPLPLVHVGIEGGYGAMGSVEDSYANDDIAADLDMKTSYAYLGGNGKFRLGPTPLSVLARAGYMKYDQKFEISGQYRDAASNGWEYLNDDLKEKESGIYYGVGLGFDPLPLLSLNLMYTGFSFSGNECDGCSLSTPESRDATTLTLGVELRF